MALVVYDNGGVSLDRYTVYPWAHSRDRAERYTYLGLSEGGRSVSMWGEAQRGPHLGKIVPFDSLSPETQAHINARIKG